MPSPNRANSARLFDTALLRRQNQADAAISAFLPSWPRYVALGRKLNLPPELIAVMHYRESSNNFSKHLHNGDPLTGRTYHVPAGRPLTGSAPFTFEESATDALSMHDLIGIGDVTIGQQLVILENYNGLGYAYKGRPSPYVWAGTSQYVSGKYVADGVYDATEVDEQCGCAALLIRLQERGIISIRGEAIMVKVAGQPKAVIPGYNVRDSCSVAVRAFVAVMGGAIAAKGDTVVITRGGQSKAIALSTFDGTGYVQVRDLASLYACNLAYVAATRLLTITPGVSK